jgi:pimeloyl-ACP methyl ester carboxylesterase
VRFFGIPRLRDAPRRAVAGGLVALAVGAQVAPASAVADPASCQDVYLPVTLAGQGQTMFGHLCRPNRPTPTVLLLVPGATYTAEYWDLPKSLGLSSFRAALNDAGYATLTVDRLGSGRSSRPASVRLTAFTQAGVLHQVVRRLRAEYSQVVIGGHSLGATAVIIEAATFHDVDGVLVAGIAHRPDPVDDVADFLTALHPAVLDPALAGRSYDPGYLTTAPGTRTRAFHSPARPSAVVTAYEESTEDAFAATEAADGLGVGVASPYTILIDAPVLVALGGQDELFCSPVPLVGTDCSSAMALHAQEAPYYSPAARLRTYLLPGRYGHSFNFAPNADLFARTVVEWVGQSSG